MGYVHDLWHGQIEDFHNAQMHIWVHVRLNGVHAHRIHSCGIPVFMFYSSLLSFTLISKIFHDTESGDWFGCLSCDGGEKSGSGLYRTISGECQM